jgi:hypothetical protein
VVPAVIFSNTVPYEWSSPAGTAKVMVTVTDDAPGYEGYFHWKYVLNNFDFGANGSPFTDPIGLFAIPVNEPVIVINVRDNKEWDGSVTGWTSGDAVVWWAEEGVDPLVASKQSAEFSFITPPRTVVEDVGEMATASYATNGGGLVAVPGPEPKVIITVIDPNTGLEVPLGTDQGLKVAKWHDAFKLTADGKGVEIKGPDATSNWDFIDRDRDRFNVWVYDPMAWSKMENGQPAVERVQVLISTENEAGFTAYDDAATAVDLVRYDKAFQGKTGWYWSDSQMLVSNDVDDDFKVEHSHLGLGYLREDDQDPAGFALPKNNYQWLESDRTHRVALGGTVKAQYFFTPNAIIVDDAPVKVAKTVMVHVTILNAGGTPVVAKADAEKYLAAANEQYAQVGIHLVPTVDNPVNPPPTVNLGNGLHAYTWPVGGAMVMTQEEKDLLGHAAFRTPWTDDIEVYYVNYFHDADGKEKQNFWGESFPASGVPDAIYADSVVVASPATKPLQWPQQIVAHEIGHILLNSGNHLEEPANSVNLMAYPAHAVTDKQNPSLLVDDVLASKRLTVEQEQIMLGWNL